MADLHDRLLPLGHGSNDQGLAGVASTTPVFNNLIVAGGPASHVYRSCSDQRAQHLCSRWGTKRSSEGQSGTSSAQRLLTHQL